MSVKQLLFKKIYGIESLATIDENYLAPILFADDKAGKALDVRGVFSCLLYGYPEYHIYKDTFGNCGTDGRCGIWYDGAEYRLYSGDDSSGTVISPQEATGYAVFLRNALDEIENLLNTSSADYIKDYLAMDVMVRVICYKWQNSPYWTEGGDLGPYLLKYFHILCPDKICGIYFDEELDSTLAKLNIVLPDGTSRFVKNGVILLAKRGLTGRLSHRITADSGTHKAEDGQEAENVGEISAEVGDGGANYPTPIMKVKVTGGYNDIVYLRGKSYGDFTGTCWEAGEPYDGEKPKNTFFFTYDSITANFYYNMYTITVQLERGVNKYYYPYFAGQTTDDLNDVEIAGLIGEDNSYTLGFYPDGTCYDAYYLRYCDNHEVLDSCCYTAYMWFGHPDTTEDAIEAEIQRGRLNGDTWHDRNSFNSVIKAVCDYFKKYYTYSYDFDFSGSNGDNVAYFLSGGTGYKGVCRHFAAAATLILRYLGIPARYVTGYCCKVKDGLVTQVTAEDAHAWVEVYNPWIGWLVVDPTPSKPGAGGGTQYLDEEDEFDTWLNENYEYILCELREKIGKYRKPPERRRFLKD